MSAIEVGLFFLLRAIVSHCARALPDPNGIATEAMTADELNARPLGRTDVGMVQWSP